MEIKSLEDGGFYIGQPYYSKNLSAIPKGINLEEFRRYRALFSWMVHTRPDLSCFANRASQVSESTYCAEKIQELNKGIKICKNSEQMGLVYRPIDKSSMEIRVYVDASFSSNDDLSSQLGYITLLCDGNNNCHILDYSSKKSKRVVRSVMAAEVYAFMDAFDAEFTLTCDMKVILGDKLPIIMFTDSKQLLDDLTKGRRTTEKRLMIDIASARHSYKKFEISGVGLVSGVSNPADSLSKVSGNDALFKLMTTGIDSSDIVQWIDRT